MISQTLPSFWDAYNKLPPESRQQARKAYRIWRDSPFHPSLHFKCINSKEKIWYVRISLGYRAIGIMEKQTVTWFWIGDHDEYENFFG
jgi:hypothetical protein